MVSHAYDRGKSQRPLVVLAVLCGLAVASLWSVAEARLDPHVKISRLGNSRRLASHRLLQEEGGGDGESTAAESDSAAGEGVPSEKAAPEADGEAETEKAVPGGEASAAESETAAEEAAPSKKAAPGADGDAETEVSAGEGSSDEEAAPDKEATTGAAVPTETVSEDGEGGPEAKTGTPKEPDESSGPKEPAEESDAKEPGEGALLPKAGGKKAIGVAALSKGDSAAEGIAAAEEDAAETATSAEATGKASTALSPAGAEMEVVGRGDEEGPTEVPPDLVPGGAAKAKAGAGKLVEGTAAVPTAPEGETEAEAEAGDKPVPVSAKKSKPKKKKTLWKRSSRKNRKPVPRKATPEPVLETKAASESPVEGEPAAERDAEESLLKPKAGEDGEGGAAGGAGASTPEKPADAESAEGTAEDETVTRDPEAAKPAEEAPETVEAAAEDSGNSGVAQEMALDSSGAAAEGGAAVGKSEVELGLGGARSSPLVAGVGAPEQLMIEQAALEDEEDYASFMSELFNAGQRISPAMQALKEKTAKHVVPTVQEFARSSHEAFMKTTDNIQTHVTPLFGPHASPAVATVLSFSLLLLPLLLIVALVYQFRFILTLQRLLVLCNLYLCLYCFALLAASVIISSEPMRSLQAAAEPNFYVLQILQALAYIIYLGLQFAWLVTVCRAKGKDRDPILIAKAALASIVAVGIGLHYYIFVFERAMLDKAPKISAWAYFTYTALFGLLTVLGRPKEVKQDVGKDT